MLDTAAISTGQNVTRTSWLVAIVQPCRPLPYAAWCQTPETTVAVAILHCQADTGP